MMKRDTGAPPAPPTIAVSQFDGLIDDTFVTACGGKIPFFFPLYADYADGDTLELWGNGKPLHVEKVPKQVLQGNPDKFDVDASFFDYTGMSNLFYKLYDAFGNPRLTDYRRYKAQRKKFPDPDDPVNTPITVLPEVTPATYNNLQYRNNEPINVRIAYDAMQVSDAVILKFELRATTSNRDPMYFYPIADIDVTLTRDDVSKGYVTWPVSAKTFDGVDENVGRVYFVVCNAQVNGDSLYLNTESRRAAIQIDVVPPYSG